MRIGKNESGSAVVEIAIGLPVLVLFIWGIVQLGLLFQANAGMQHALGEAARFATIWPTPTDAQIRSKMAAKKFGTGTGTLSNLDIQNQNSGGPGTQYKLLTLTYSQQMNFLFFRGPTVTLTRSKRVYVAG
jgi:Flp pilus assembly protein TadG